MKKKPIKTKWGFSFSHQRVFGTVVVEYVQYECEIVATVILLYGQVLLSCQLLSVYKRKDEGNIMIRKKKKNSSFAWQCVEQSSNFWTENRIVLQCSGTGP